MPIRDIIIPETSSSILEPISKEVTGIVLSKLGLYSFFKNNIYITNDYTKASLTNDGDDHNALISKDRCDVVMATSMNPTEMKWDINSFKYTQAYGVVGVRDKSLRPVFCDPIADVQLVEHQLPCTMTLEFSLKFKNREAAFMTISAINNTSLKDSVINYHDLVYEYPLGNDLATSLQQIYALRAPSLTNPDFYTYLKYNSQNAIQKIQQRTGNLIQLVIKRQDIQAYGVLEYNQNTPQVQEQDNGIDRFVVDFTYTIQFARPDVLRLYFPVVIENQLVPNWLLRFQQPNYLATVYGFFQERSMTAYLRSQLSNIPVVVRLPEYDDFRPPQQPAIAAGFAEIFNSALLLETTGPTTIDLNNLGPEISLNPTALQIILLHGQEIFATTGLFNITIYCNGLAVDPSLVSIDTTGVVTLNMTNTSRRYHFSISEATNLRYLSSKWIQTLLEFRTFFPVTIIRNLQYLVNLGYCYIDKTNALLILIQSSIMNLTIDAQIAILISEGHLNSYAYCFATTAEQFATYLMDTTSPVSGRLVYDEYVALCINQGLITQAQLASGYVKTKDGYPFLPSNVRGALGKYFNMPFRIQQSNIVVQQA